MKEIKRLTISQVHKEPSLLYKEIPFQLTRHGKVIAEVVKPGAGWHICEICEGRTPNMLDFKDKESGTWQELILCDECQEEYL